MSFFSIPLSGLDAASEALSVISNNLANVDTDGFKDQNISFKDLFYQGYGADGGGTQLQIGDGVGVEATTADFSNGTISSTGVPTNMAITGNGFFVTQDPNGTVEYTRDGDFTVNSSGQLVTQSGQLVLGYPAVDGVISPGGVPQALNLSETATNPASATTSFSLTSNLDAGADTGTTFSTPLTVYDSLGNSHTLDFTFTKTADNSWSYNVTLPGADTGASSPTTVTSGSLTFDSSGNLTSPSSGITGISITGLADGAAPMSLTWNLYGTGGAGDLTQTAAASATEGTDQNGYPSGTLQSFSVDATGTIHGVFSNDQTTAIGQVAIANFQNNQGLQLVGNNSYMATQASGAAAIGVAGTGNLGSITGGAVEASNVDVATEFSKMIAAQRDYEASAKALTTMNTISDDTMNLIR